MKIFFALTFMSLSFGAFAQSIVGDYEHDKKIVIMAQDSRQCRYDGGTWDFRDQSCVISTADVASISVRNKKLNVRIATVDHNGHSCEFSGPAQMVSERKVITNSSEDENCEVELEVENDGSLSITSNDQCSSQCVENANLEAKKLKKVK